MGEDVTVKDWIAIELTNLDSNNSSNANIFSLPSNSNNGLAAPSGYYNDVVDPVKLVDVNGVGGWFLRNDDTGLFEPVAGVVADIDALISALNAATDAIWTYESAGAGQVHIYTSQAGSVPYNLLRSDLATYNITPTANVIFGSSVQVTVESGLTYDEVVSELTLGCYLLHHVNVYAANISQLNNPFQIVTRRTNGLEFDTLENPAILPIQQQFALQNVPLDYRPKPANALNYRVNAGETIRLIFKYSKSGNCTEPKVYATFYNAEKIDYDLAIEDPSLQYVFIEPSNPMYELLKLPKEWNMPKEYRPDSIPLSAVIRNGSSIYPQSDSK